MNRSSCSFLFLACALTLSLGGCGDDDSTVLDGGGVDAAPDVSNPDGCSVCDSPPADLCLENGDVRVYERSGTCGAEGCEYAFEDIACGGGCEAGRCLADLCEDVACDSPPSQRCASAMVLELFDSGGTCIEATGQCAYGSRELRCPNGCVDDACEPVTCAGVVCDAPPSPCFEAIGECRENECIYSLRPAGTSCDDGDACTEGDSCTEGSCAGAALRCDDAPADRCSDESTLVVYARVGVCSEGSCAYTESEMTCALGCAEGSCLMDPCTDVECETPPSECFAMAGICTGGECSYEPLEGVECDDGDACTAMDQCGDGVCAGRALRCDTPPVATCADPMTRRTFGAAGTCSEGECDYPFEDTTCEEGQVCSEGRCDFECDVATSPETWGSEDENVRAPAVASFEGNTIAVYAANGDLNARLRFADGRTSSRFGATMGGNAFSEPAAVADGDGFQYLVIVEQFIGGIRSYAIQHVVLNASGGSVSNTLRTVSGSLGVTDSKPRIITSDGVHFLVYRAFRSSTVGSPLELRVARLDTLSTVASWTDGVLAESEVTATNEGFARVYSRDDRAIVEQRDRDGNLIGSLLPIHVPEDAVREPEIFTATGDRYLFGIGRVFWMTDLEGNLVGREHIFDAGVQAIVTRGEDHLVALTTISAVTFQRVSGESVLLERFSEAETIPRVNFSFAAWTGSQWFVGFQHDVRSSTEQARLMRICRGF